MVEGGQGLVVGGGSLHCGAAGHRVVGRLEESVGGEGMEGWGAVFIARGLKITILICVIVSLVICLMLGVRAKKQEEEEGKAKGHCLKSSSIPREVIFKKGTSNKVAELHAGRQPGAVLTQFGNRHQIYLL